MWLSGECAQARDSDPSLADAGRMFSPLRASVLSPMRGYFMPFYLCEWPTARMACEMIVEYYEGCSTGENRVLRMPGSRECVLGGICVPGSEDFPPPAWSRLAVRTLHDLLEWTNLCFRGSPHPSGTALMFGNRVWSSAGSSCI